jgi:hypothetical protein
VNFSGKRTVTARAAARSIHPFTRLQIVVNGNAVASSPAPVRDEAGVYSAELRTKIELHRSAWVAARVAEPVLEGRAILPRRMTVFAHTNPVYFRRDGAKVRVQEAIDYLTLYLRYSEHWFRTAAKFESEEKRQEALKAVAEAMAIYRAL